MSLTGLEIRNSLNHSLLEFHQKYLGQYHLNIPTGVLHKIDEYRKYYVPYLQESYYKSNICYLLQVIDYQIWLYKLFKPSFSLENAYFFQLLISMGIISEAICMAILVDPLLSLNKTEFNQYLISRISKHSFHTNLKILKDLKLLDTQLLDEYQSVRIDIRNLVHMHNWGSSLHNTLTFNNFEEKLNIFKKVLFNIKENIKIHHTQESIIHAIFGDSIDFEKEYQGTIRSYSQKGSYGFISVSNFHSEVFFHQSAVINYTSSKKIKNQWVKFTLSIGKKGLEAQNIICC